MSDAPVSTPRTMIERQLKPDDVGAAGFLKWLKIALPSVYQGILPDVQKLQTQARMANISGGITLGEAGTSTDVPAGTQSASSTWADSISKLISAYGQYKLTDQQLDVVKQITQANLQRAQQGLSPLPYDASQLGLAPTVNFGLSGGTSQLVMYSAIGLGAILLLSTFMGKRRAA